MDASDAVAAEGTGVSDPRRWRTLGLLGVAQLMLVVDVTVVAIALPDMQADLALDAGEKEKRHELMAKLNAAYSAGDQNRLNKLVEDFRDSPDLIRGDSPGDTWLRRMGKAQPVAQFLDHVWPAVTAEQLVWELLSDPEALEAHDELEQREKRE